MKLLEVLLIVLLTLLINNCLNQTAQADGVYQRCTIQNGVVTTCSGPFNGEAPVRK